MGLETGDFIADLDPNNPLGGDPKSEGDDHIRLTKRCLTGSFGAFVGTTASPASVLLTEAQINDTTRQSEPALITASWAFSATLAFAAPLRLANNVDLTGRNVADANDVLIGKLTTTDRIQRGQNNNNFAGINDIVGDAGEHRFQHGSDQVMNTVSRADGSLLIRDRSGTTRKAGFRNPERMNVSANRSVTQDDEGQLLHAQSATTDITLEVLEKDTTLRVLNSLSIPITLTAGTSVTIEAFRGSGEPEVTSQITVPGGGLVELIWANTTGLVYAVGHITGVA